MYKSNLTALAIGLLVCLISFVGILPGTAYASLPLGITLTPTSTQEPPTLTPPPPTDTPVMPTHTPTSTTIVKPPSTPTPTALPPTPTPEPEEPEEQKPTKQPILLPQTGDYPPHSPGFGLDGFGSLAIPLLALVAGLALGILIGPRIRKWLG